MEVLNSTLFTFGSMVWKIKPPDYSFTLIVKGTFDLLPGQMAVMAKEEEQMFPTGDEYYDEDMERSCRYDSDFAYFKPRADLLLAGKCHAPDQKPIQACQVTFRVGDRAKSLAVFGNRYWEGLMRVVSVPEPFTEMSLNYEHSFGGKAFKKNPVGKGYKKEQDEAGSTIRPLPKIEDPKHLIVSPLNRPEPVGFGPLGRMWSQRYAKVGTYKGKWLKERWPWFPKDFDWGYFNAAPSDMQVEGYLKGDEPLYFENLHPKRPRYHSQLPGLRVRCFLNELDPKDGQRTIFREVPMNLDTLWVDMEADKFVLVWRGVAPIRSEEYEEIGHVFIVSEKLEEKAESLDYYENLFKKTLVEEEAGEEYQVQPLESVEETDTTEIDREIAKAEEQMRASLVAAGFDPDNLPPPSEEDKEKEAKLLKELGFEDYLETPPLTREIVQERIARGEGLAKEDLRGIDLSGLEMRGVNFQEAVLTGVVFKESNLSGANLSEANLVGADFSGAILHKTILKDADLTSATFVGADLAGAVLEEAICEKANLKNANLDQVIATDANFSEANLTEASLKEASLQGADFSKSLLDRTNFQGSNLREASVEGAVGIQVNMSEADLTELRASEGCNFTQGSFEKATGLESIWENANLTEADFSFSNMEAADFSSATMERANFSAADMKFSRFTKANIREARFIQMNLFQGSLEKADLTRADFRGSNLYGVEFLDSVVEETKFESANLKMSKLAKS